MAGYTKDPDGVIHVINSADSGGQFTFCSRDIIDDDPETGSFSGESSSGPSTCAECKAAVSQIREAISGVKWRI